jgi:hypothetical protein
MNLRKDRGYVLREPSDAETPLLDRLVPSNDYPVDPAWLDAVLAAMRIGARSHQWEAKAPG